MQFKNVRVHSVKTDQVKREHTVSFKVPVSKDNANDVKRLARFADMDASDVTLNVTRRQLPMKGLEATADHHKQMNTQIKKESDAPPF